MSSEANPARLADYTPEWPRRAAVLLDTIQGAFQGIDGAQEAAFDHIGSTAVPGLAAKPYLDLQVRIEPLPQEAELIPRLERLGFVRARGSRPDSPGVNHDIPRGDQDVEASVWNKMLFWSESDDAILHIRRKVSPWGLYTVWFRDWLRADEIVRQRYEAIKRTLSEQQVGKRDYDDYTLANTAFFDEVQQEFEQWAATVGVAHRDRAPGG